MSHVLSKDGTRIAYDATGAGPPLVIVWGALGARSMAFARKTCDELAKSFTVHHYDRRGRGESGDAKPYAVEREIEDLRAVCEAAGGAPFVWATSSGAVLALEAAASGVPMHMLAAYEPPFAVGGHAASFDRDYEKNVTDLIAAGRREEALTCFLRAVGLPRVMTWLLPLLPVWKDMVALAHTLPYDAAITGRFEVPETRLRQIRVPTVLLAGARSPARLQAAADAVARVVPGATLRTVPKQDHAIKPAALRQVLVEEFGRQPKEGLAAPAVLPQR